MRRRNIFAEIFFTTLLDLALLAAGGVIIQAGTRPVTFLAVRSNLMFLGLNYFISQSIDKVIQVCLLTSTVVDYHRQQAIRRMSVGRF